MAPDVDLFPHDAGNGSCSIRSARGVAYLLRVLLSERYYRSKTKETIMGKNSALTFFLLATLASACGAQLSSWPSRSHFGARATWPLERISPPPKFAICPVLHPARQLAPQQAAP